MESYAKPLSMPDLDSPSSFPAFHTTRWSLVLRAACDASELPETREALESLCRSYWHPLYCFVRRQGRSPEAAEDLTQDLFALILSRPVLAAAAPEKGRFRTYLLAVLKHVLAQARERESAGKRGGGATLVPLDALDAEERYRLEPADEHSPELFFDRRWAATVMARATERLRGEYAEGDRFETLEDFLLTGRQAASYATAAAALGLSESALKSAVFKLRQRFSAALRAEIAETVASESEIEGELRHLAKVLGA